jgi:hypothetical protein
MSGSRTQAKNRQRERSAQSGSTLILVLLFSLIVSAITPFTCFKRA